VTRPLVVCADDYAYSPAICDAIVDLAQRGRISAVSCMTTSPLWPEQAQRLRPLRGGIDIGLHLVLIEEKPLTAMPHTAPDGRLPSLTALMARAFAGRLARDEIAAEIDAQCRAFVDALGMPPVHLDGHRHTHVLPGIRELVLAAAARVAPRAYVRAIAEPVVRTLKRGVALPKTLFLSALGAGMDSAAARHGVPVNDGFSGIYSLAPTADVPALFARFAATAGPRPLLMCHPGGDDGTALGATRAKEYAYLRSDAFPVLLAAHGLHVGRFDASAS
jgi:predicted glycoside hydrolase/deacetylase ChbG (UPF0249 family)